MYLRKMPLVLLFFASLLAGACSRVSQPAPRSFKIAVIPQGSTHEYWKSIHAGAVKAAQDLKAAGIDVTLFWKGASAKTTASNRYRLLKGSFHRASTASCWRHSIAARWFVRWRKLNAPGFPR